MHLGRFHFTIHDLHTYFKNAKLPAALEECAAALDLYSQNRLEEQLQIFRSAFDKAIKATEVKDADLHQPYAQQIIQEINADQYLGNSLATTLHEIIAERAFDHAGIAKDFRDIGVKISQIFADITAIEDSFTRLEVEYQSLDTLESEVGLLLPREIVGETLTSLTAEFSKLGKLSRAINELTGANDYDPIVRTISSSWWQVFLDLDPNQVLVWVVAVERIVQLFKSNLEIKNLQDALLQKKMPKTITDQIDAEIDQRLSSAIKDLATELRRDYGKIEDEGRLNEVETQLRQGLHYLAKRINQGAQVEINVGLPPKEIPSMDAQAISAEDMQRLTTAAKEKTAELRALRARARAASVDTLNIDGTSQALLKYFDEGEHENGPKKSE